ncbi:MAG: REP-associated tyrosine transposase [Methylophilus sp.]
MDYRRAWHAGGTYFFTLNLLMRKDNDLLVKHVDILKIAINQVKQAHPFKIHAWVILPDHMHCVMELPQEDCNFATRLRLIKINFSKALPKTEHRSQVRIKRGERGIWQRRYWEHLIKDEADYKAHIDYVHINPVKHALVMQVKDWPYSTFHRLVEEGIYPQDWGGGIEGKLSYAD